MDKGSRLRSLDALRGFDMLFIMGLAPLIARLCAALGCGDCWLAGQMVHPEWMGFTHHDTIFPLFIFIAGVSTPYSIDRQLSEGRSRGKIGLRILWRAAVLFFLGMVFSGFFMGAPFRFGSVLARIGIAWACGAWLYLCCRPRTRVVVACLLVLSYWALNLFAAAPDFPEKGAWTPQGNIVCWFDRAFVSGFSVLRPGTEALPFDNQGFLSNAMAAVTAMLGVFTGEFVRKEGISGTRRTLWLLAAAVVLAVAGLVIAHGCGRWSFPLSKVLWSPSFVCVAGAYSVGMFAVFYWLIDVTGIWKRTLFFEVIGLNSVTIYLAQPLLGFDRLNEMLFGRFCSLFRAPWNGIAESFTYIAVCWLFLLILYRKRVFLKV
jgi:predicted acyltransferase